MTFEGEQGPFHDAIGVWPDDEGTGWIYDPARTFCFRCGDQEVIGDEDIFCWSCQSPVPMTWEREHEDVFFLTEGILGDKR